MPTNTKRLGSYLGNSKFEKRSEHYVVSLAEKDAIRKQKEKEKKEKIEAKENKKALDAVLDIFLNEKSDLIEVRNQTTSIDIDMQV